MPLGSIHVVASGKISFFVCMGMYVFISGWVNKENVCVCVCVCDNLGCFCGLAIVSNTAVNMECISFWITVFILFR